ncbi:hypothetical protein FA15DRAFT_75915 [Coprinopsis marcescibilis]|uniref:C2 NT-type domain-containing protein n=1 Tax=Coprinopsis marcescibilis TaxID=230819 RepID=A0A5C3L6X2_COPMA|nr:hypothetical protein FA15DRAFT_75915 [Coprinopsis marcescibilis]
MSSSIPTPDLASQEGAQPPQTSRSTPPPPPPILTRQNSVPTTSQEPRTKVRNSRNLTLPSPISPSTSNSSGITVQPHRYQSLAEGVNSFAVEAATPISPGQQGGSFTPLILPQSIQHSSSRPGTPSLFARSAAPGTPAVPKTPLLSRTPLNPTSPLPSAGLGGPTPGKTPTTATTKGKLKALLPRSHHQAHSYFHAKIEIEQLSNVPLIRGEFGVRWKFKGNVAFADVKGERPGASNEGRHHGEEGSGLLGKMKNLSNKGKGKDDHHGASESGMSQGKWNGSSPSLVSQGSHGHTSSVHTQWSHSSTDSYTSTTTNGSTASSASFASHTTTATSMPSTVNSKKADGNLSRNFFSNTSPSSTSPGGNGLNHYLFSSVSNAKAYEESLLFSPNYNQQSFSSNAALGGLPTSPGYQGLDAALSPGLGGVLSPTGTITQANASSHPMGGILSPRDGAFFPSSNHPAGHLSPSRGITPYLPLKEHSIGFNFPLNAILKFDIARGNAQDQKKPNILPNEFKLVVMQRVIPDDPDGPPQNPRLGAVYLNMAEYVDKGKVERRYLLKESRVNATLKITIEMTHVSGNMEYIAPPLPKAEIMGGIENFLTQNDSLMKKRKDLYGLTYGNGTKDDLDGELFEENVGQEEHSTPQDRDPYGLPSESESELDEDPNSEAAQARRQFLKSLKNPPTKPTPTRSQTQTQPQNKADMSEREKRRVIKRDERKRRFHLELERNPYALPPISGESESESDADADSESDAFESATEDDAQSQVKDTDSIALTEESQQSPDQNVQQNPARRYNLVEVATFDVKRLPLAYGPKTTEALIDALFNPVLTMDKKRDNPFTMYVDPEEVDRMDEYERQLLFARYGKGKYGDLSNTMLPYQGSQPPGMGGRSFSRETTSTTTSESGGSGGHDDVERFGRLKSPGEETIVGVPMHQNSIGMGLGIVGLLGSGVPLERERDATIGRHAEKSGGVGTLLHQYYRDKKDKIALSRRKTKPIRSDTASTYASTASVSASEDDHGQQPYSYARRQVATEPTTAVLGSPVYVQEPQEMETSIFSKHQKLGTGGTDESELINVLTNNSSSTSLSSLSLSSRSGHGHGPSIPSVPPLIPGNVAAAAAASSIGNLDSPPKPVQRQPTVDLSVPDGRMDRTGFVKGGSNKNPAVGLGGSFNRWWKGLGASSTDVAGHAATSNATQH